MGFLILVLIALVTWFYLQNKNLQKQAKTAQRKALQLNEEKNRERRPAETASIARNNSKEEIITESFDNRESSSVEQARQHRNTSNQQNSNSLNTGIAELDGPGMFQRLTRLGPSASAVYLLYSEQHNAYKVGYCDPRGIGNRIRQIKPEVPDVKLVGTAVFTSSQNAFNAEQRILNRYRRNRYSGIRGRWSGSTEWITQRPTGRPYLTDPTSVEERYQAELAATPERPIEEDVYTVYLMKSPSMGIHKASWCRTDGINEKLRIARREIASDAQIVSRFPIQTPHRARAIAQRFNEDAGSLNIDGRRETYEWTTNDAYLDKFRGWGADGIRIT